MENLTRSERKREILLRENEKLKADSKANRRGNNVSALISNPQAF